MQNNQKTSNIHTSHKDNKNKLNSYQNNKQLPQHQHNLQPHQRQSIKGLFTFYREQEQNQNQLIIMKEEIQSKQRKLQDKYKEKVEGRKGKGKIKDVYGEDKIENDLKEVIVKQLRNKSKNSKGQTKMKRNKNQSMLQDSVYRAKKRKKGKKSTRVSTERQEDPQNTSQQQKNEHPQQHIPEQPEYPAQQFLKIIKQRKITKSPKLGEPLKTQTQDNINTNTDNINTYKNNNHLPTIHDVYSFDKGKFNKLFYPKQSQQIQLLVDDVNADLGQYQYQNRFVRLEGGSGRGKQKGRQILVASIGVDKEGVNFSQERSQNKKKIVIDQIFLKRSSSEIQKALSNRKRMYTQSQKAAKASEKTTPKTNYMKDNIYSHTKLKQIVQLANRIGPKQESQPISPPTYKNLYTQPPSSLNYQNSALKLPVIRNVRLSRQLRKIEQIKNEENNRYGTNKSKNSQNGRSNKSVSRAVIHEKLGKSKSTHHYRQHDRDDLMAQRLTNQNKKSGINETNEAQTEKDKSSKQKQQQRQKQKQKHRQKSRMGKKLETQPQMYCLALIDLSKSVNSGVESGDRKKIKKSEIGPSWSMKKKILFKKLGLQV